MPFPVYTQADLAARVLARLVEVGVASGASLPASNVPEQIGRTLEDLVERALTRLGEVGFGQAPEPEAADRLRDLVPEVLVDIAARRIYPPVSVPIPSEAFDALATILASRSSADFGLPADEQTLLAQRAQAAEKMLIAVRLPARIANAIPALLAEFYTDRIYAFPVDDFIRPDGFDALVSLCAGRLASEITPEKAQILIPEAQAAEMRLRRMRAQAAPSTPLRVSYF